MTEEQKPKGRGKRSKAERDEEKAQRREDREQEKAERSEAKQAKEEEATAEEEQEQEEEQPQPDEPYIDHREYGGGGELRSPRDLDRRPPSEGGEAGPAHVRSGRGVRTTAETDEELREEAYENAVSVGYERVEWRTDGAGPNPYHLETSGERIGGMEQAAEMTKEIIEADGAYFLEPHQVASYLASSADDDYTANATDAEVATIAETFTDTGQKLVENPDRIDAQERAVLERIDRKHGDALQKHEDSVGEEDSIADDYRVAAAHAEATEVSEEPLRADANPGSKQLYGGEEDTRSEEGEQK